MDDLLLRRRLMMQSGRDYSKEYLTFEMLEAGSLYLNKIGTLDNYSNNARPYYRKNGGSWTQAGYWNALISITGLLAGDKIELKMSFGYHISSDESNYRLIYSNAQHIIYGNILSLVYGDDFVGETQLPGVDTAGAGKEYWFCHLFSDYNNAGSNYLVSAENLILPVMRLNAGIYSNLFRHDRYLTTPPKILPAVTTLDGSNNRSSVYRYMFRDCNVMTKAPKIMLSVMGTYAMHYMFYGCSALEEAPELLPTTTTNYCYYAMFTNCTSLKKAPALPATNAAQNCYRAMFKGCTNLEEAQDTLPATSLGSNCYYEMFSGCSKLKKAPVLPATTLASACYQSMFYNCAKLNYVKALFSSSYDSTTYLTSWLSGVATYGTFIANANNLTSTSNKPSSWRIVPANWSMSSAIMPDSSTYPTQNFKNSIIFSSSTELFTKVYEDGVPFTWEVEWTRTQNDREFLVCDKNNYSSNRNLEIDVRQYYGPVEYCYFLYSNSNGIGLAHSPTLNTPSTFVVNSPADGKTMTLTSSGVSCAQTDGRNDALEQFHFNASIKKIHKSVITLNGDIVQYLVPVEFYDWDNAHWTGMWDYVKGELLRDPNDIDGFDVD